MGPIRAERHRLRLLKAQEPVLDNPHPDEVQGWSSCENLHTIVAPFKRGLKPKVLAKIKKSETYQRGSRELAKIPRQKVSLYPKKAKPQPILEGFSQLNISDWRNDDFDTDDHTASFTDLDISNWTDTDFDNYQDVDVTKWSHNDFSK